MRLPLSAHAEDPWIVRPEWVAAHEAFLASDALNGRGSATRDEAIAAAYVASQFQGSGLKTAPGMAGYLQTAVIVRPRLDGPVSLTAGTAAIKDGLTLLTSSGQGTGGTLTVFTGDDAKALPSADVVLLAPATAPVTGFLRAAGSKKIKLLIVRESDETKGLWGRFGNKTAMTPHLDGEAPEGQRINIVVLPAAAFDTLKGQPGVNVSLNLPPVVADSTV